jgi:hypothetical protein
MSDAPDVGEDGDVVVEELDEASLVASRPTSNDRRAIGGARGRMS